MNDSEIPANPPPPYSKNPTAADAARLSINIPAQARRSMEDELRPLPEGWVRQWDSQNSHQFFVNTKSDPPRSIWHHPYDDEEYLATLSSDEREALQEAETRRNRRQDMSPGVTDDELDSATSPNKPANTSAPAGHGATGAAGPSSSSAAAATSSPEIQGGKGKESFGRRMKDKLTGTTHEQRQVDRQRRAEEERQAYELHLTVRRAMSRAMETGEPQFVCKDPRGHDVYVEPPRYAGSYGYGRRGYNPYAQGPYTDPNARFLRPAGPYGRPYGGGYGGGLGLPIAGGLAGGLLLGGLLGGF